MMTRSLNASSRASSLPPQLNGGHGMFVRLDIIDAPIPLRRPYLIANMHFPDKSSCRIAAAPALNYAAVSYAASLIRTALSKLVQRLAAICKLSAVHATNATHPLHFRLFVVIARV